MEDNKAKVLTPEETENYRNWLEELSSEDEGLRIIRKSSKQDLYELFKRVTGKEAIHE